MAKLRWNNNGFSFDKEMQACDLVTCFLKIQRWLCDQLTLLAVDWVHPEVVGFIDCYNNGKWCQNKVFHWLNAVVNARIDFKRATEMWVFLVFGGAWELGVEYGVCLERLMELSLDVAHSKFLETLQRLLFFSWSQWDYKCFYNLIRIVI